MIELAVFDWNGTIVDDTFAVIDADNDVLRALGCPPVEYSRFLETNSIPKSEFYIANGCSAELISAQLMQVADIAHSNYEELAKNCELRDGVLNVLEWLHKHSIPTIILSNHTVAGIECQLVRLELSRYFSEVLANADRHTFLKGGKLQKLKNYLAARKLNHKKVVIFGDSPEEAVIASELGTKSILIGGGAYSSARLQSATPDYLFENFEPVLSVLSSEL